jgi:hypothetical protein
VSSIIVIDHDFLIFGDICQEIATITDILVLPHLEYVYDLAKVGSR